MPNRDLEAATRVRLSAGPESQQPPSAVRERFDGLVRRLEACRAALHAWDEALPRWRERYHEQAGPLFRRRDELDAELLGLLDHAHATYRLGKAERGLLSELIGELADALVQHGRDDLAPLRDRHAGTGHGDAAGVDEQRLRLALAAHFGLDPEDMDAVEVPEAVVEQVRERLRGQQAHARGRDERARARQARARSPAVEAPAPLRTLYRKLANALHPDRESDPAERERKTVLMQRLNQAYRAGNLLALIELQLEIGQLLPEQLRDMSGERVEAYSRDLERQLAQAESTLAQVERDFREDYGVAGTKRLRPERLDALLAQTKRELAADIAGLEDDLRDLRDPRDPAAIRQWLKRQRRMAVDEASGCAEETSG